MAHVNIHIVCVLQCVAVCCSVVPCVAGWCRVLQGGAVCCSMLHCLPVHAVPQHTATHTFGVGRMGNRKVRGGADLGRTLQGVSISVAVSGHLCVNVTECVCVCVRARASECVCACVCV